MKIGKFEQHNCKVDDKKEYFVRIRNLKQALLLNYCIRLWKVQRVIKFIWGPWLIEYILHEYRFRKIVKNCFESYFYKLMNDSVLGKTMKNARKHRYIRLWTTERRRSYLLS